MPLWECRRRIACPYSRVRCPPPWEDWAKEKSKSVGERGHFACRREARSPQGPARHHTNRQLLLLQVWRTDCRAPLLARQPRNKGWCGAHPVPNLTTAETMTAHLSFDLVKHISSTNCFWKVSSKAPDRNVAGPTTIAVEDAPARDVPLQLPFRCPSRCPQEEGREQKKCRGEGRGGLRDPTLPLSSLPHFPFILLFLIKSGPRMRRHHSSICHLPGS